MLDARRLVVFRAVAQTGSLSAAAESLSYTTSAVSQQMAALEREVGLQLLERRARGVVLTEAGQLLLAHAHRVIDELEAAGAALADFAAQRGGRVRIASFATASARVVPSVIELYRARFPQIAIHVERATSREGLDRLRRGRLDLVLAVDQPEAPDLEVATLFADPFRLALHRSHPRATASDLRLGELVDETWIDVPGDVSGGAIAARALGTVVTVAHASDDYTAIHAMVGAGLGIALVPCLALFPASADVVLRDLGPDAPRRLIQAVTRLPEQRSTATSALLDVLRDYVPPVSDAVPNRYAGP